MKNERRKTPTNCMCLHMFGFNNLLQALFKLALSLLQRGMKYILDCMNTNNTNTNTNNNTNKNKNNE